VEATVPIQVRGVDSQGATFDEATNALEVSRRGLSFQTLHDLPLFTNLTVVIPGLGPVRTTDEGPTDFFAEATVVRTTREKNGTFHVALRFRGATLPIYSPEIG
jgi:hypothetical protein